MEIVKGQRYRHPMLRGVWTVKSATDKFVTLKADNPTFKNRRVPAYAFPTDLGKNWEKV